MRYRKKPIVIEAIQWTGSNEIEIMLFVGEELKICTPPHGLELNYNVPHDAYSLIIPTLEGNMVAIRTDWIIKGINGEFYPCKDDIFKKTYESVQ